MSYDLHITRDDEIPLDEWIAAVDSTEGVRINNEDIVMTNPQSGQEIRLVCAPGAAEVYFREQSCWHRVFSFSGNASFRAPSDWEDPSSPIRQVTFKLARLLGASVTGDEGEIYNET
ncbi:MAG: hypothetical protein MI864_22490 [Pseudomonadales bacterium]|nr:hypothetical protein [Pseudomonadales bacterium]